MLCEAYTHTVQPYAYGTENHTIRVWYVPYAYGMEYAYGTQHLYWLATIISRRPLFRPQIKPEKSGLATRDLKLCVRRECIVHEIFITKITFSKQIWQTTKILVFENFRLYGIIKMKDDKKQFSLTLTFSPSNIHQFLVQQYR